MPVVPSVMQLRRDHEKSLRDPDGYLSIIALAKLKEGTNTFGSAQGSDILLPARAPAKAGRFELEKGVVTVFLDAPGTINGRQLRSAVLADSPPDRVKIGDITLHIHPMADALGIRVRDPKAKSLKQLRRLSWYPVDPKYAVRATFERYDKPRTVEVARVGGGSNPYEVPGLIKAVINGQPVEFEPFEAGPGQLWMIFKDLTSGKETYAAARFLDGIVLNADGSVLVDFNRAVNPPCAYSPYTTCPLPPPKNRLKVRIPAGEKKYH